MRRLLASLIVLLAATVHAQTPSYRRGTAVSFTARTALVVAGDYDGHLVRAGESRLVLIKMDGRNVIHFTVPANLTLGRWTMDTIGSSGHPNDTRSLGYVFNVVP